MEGQRQAGIENSTQTLTIRRLRSRNAVPAVWSFGGSAFVTLLDCDLAGGKEPASAVESTHGATLVVFRMKTAGYANAIRSQALDEEQVVRGPVVKSFVSHASLPTSVKQVPAPAAIIPDPPEAALPLIEEWADGMPTFPVALHAGGWFFRCQRMGLITWGC
jgi:hypothetical protein